VVGKLYFVDVFSMFEIKLEKRKKRKQRKRIWKCCSLFKGCVVD